LTDQQMAADVFERRGPFDPAADTIVRSSMLRLRQKLDIYFNEEGAAEPLRIRIPRGGYSPVFESVGQPDGSLPAATAATVPAPKRFPQLSRRALVITA